MKDYSVPSTDSKLNLNIRVPSQQKKSLSKFPTIFNSAKWLGAKSESVTRKNISGIKQDLKTYIIIIVFLISVVFFCLGEDYLTASFYLNWFHSMLLSLCCFYRTFRLWIRKNLIPHMFPRLRYLIFPSYLNTAESWQGDGKDNDWYSKTTLHLVDQKKARTHDKWSTKLLPKIRENRLDLFKNSKFYSSLVDASSKFRNSNTFLEFEASNKVFDLQSNKSNTFNSELVKGRRYKNYLLFHNTNHLSGGLPKNFDSFHTSNKSAYSMNSILNKYSNYYLTNNNLNTEKYTPFNVYDLFDPRKVGTKYNLESMQNLSKNERWLLANSIQSNGLNRFLNSHPQALRSLGTSFDKNDFNNNLSWYKKNNTAKNILNLNLNSLNSNTLINSTISNESDAKLNTINSGLVFNVTLNQKTYNLSIENLPTPHTTKIPDAVKNFHIMNYNSTIFHDYFYKQIIQNKKVHDIVSIKPSITSSDMPEALTLVNPSLLLKTKPIIQHHDFFKYITDNTKRTHIELPLHINIRMYCLWTNDDLDTQMLNIETMILWHLKNNHYYSKSKPNNTVLK